VCDFQVLVTDILPTNRTLQKQIEQARKHGTQLGEIIESNKAVTDRS